MIHARTNPSARQPDEEPVDILVVGGDETTASTASHLESLHDRFRPTAAVVTDSPNSEEWVADDPDCIVCTQTLLTAEREAVLSAIAKRDRHGRPVFVLTEDPESCCSGAHTGVVTEYVEPRRFRQDATVAHRIVAAVESYRTQRELARESREKEIILEILRTTSSQDEVGNSFCEFVIAERDYQGVWIGTADETGTIVPRWSAGDAVYVERLVARESGRPDQTTDPGIVAFETGTVELVSPVDPAEGGWQAAAAEDGIESAVGVPIRYDNTVFGALSVYDDGNLRRADEFVSGLAQTVGYALRSASCRESLLSTAPLAVEIKITDESVPLIGALQELSADTRLTVLTAVPHEETIRYVVETNGVSPEKVVAACRPAVDDVAVITEHPPRVELDCERPAPETVFAAHGINLVCASVTPSGIVLTVTVPTRERAQQLVTDLESRYAGVGVRSVQARERKQPASQDRLLDRLTARQQQILEFAYFNGYFERPRQNTTTEIGDKLGLSRQTIAQHLRTGERKIFAELFDPEDSEE